MKGLIGGLGRSLLGVALLTLTAAPSAAATWIVDAACPDAATDPTDAVPPFCTIGRGAQAASPGDTVSVLPGVYREQVTPPLSGFAGLPITFVAADDGVRILGTTDVSAPAAWAPTATDAWSRGFVPDPNQVFLDGARLAEATSAAATTPGSWFYDATSDVLYVDVGGANPGVGHGVEAGARSHGFRILNRSHLVVEGFEIEGQNLNGLLVGTSGAIVVRENTIALTGSRGINVEEATGPITIEGNDVSLAGGIGIRVFGSTGATLEGNTSHDNANHGIGLIGSSGSSIVGNVLHSNAVPAGTSAVGVDLSTGSSNNVVRANTAFENQDTGFEIDGGSNGNLLVRNVSSGNGDHGFDVRASTGTRFVSNTSQGNERDGFSVESGASDTRLSSNIVVDNGLLTAHFELFVGNPPGTFSSDHDLFWRSGPGNLVRFGPTGFATLAAFTAATGHEVHGLQADPRFVDAPGGDLRVQLGPALDSADAGATGFSLEDHDGVLPLDIPAIANTGAGTPPFADRGAFEYVNEPPSAHLAVGPHGQRAPVLATANAAKSSDDVGIASYLFDFGDGTLVGPQPGSLATHTYTEPGNYRIRVTVTDLAGFTVSHAKNLHVGKPPKLK